MRGVTLSQAWMTARGANLQLLAAIVSPFLQPSVSPAAGSPSSFLVHLFLMTMFGAVFLSFAALLLESLRVCSLPLPDAQPDAGAQAQARITSAVAWLRLYATCLLILAFVCQFLIVRNGVTHGAGWPGLMPALLVAILVLLCLWLAFHSPASESAACSKAAAATTLTSSATASMDTEFPSQTHGCSSEELHRDIEFGQHVDPGASAMCATSSLEEVLQDWKFTEVLSCFPPSFESSASE